MPRKYTPLVQCDRHQSAVLKRLTPTPQDYWPLHVARKLVLHMKV